MKTMILHDFSRRAQRVTAIAGVIGVVLLGMWNCNYPNLPGAVNKAPRVRLANVPANDTIKQYISQGTIPELTLHWVGDDEDGFVIAYRYQWDDLYIGRPPIPRPSQTVLNLVSIGTTVLPRVMLIPGTPRSLSSMYTFFSTLQEGDADLTRQIADSLKTGRPFAVPYKSGVVPGDSVMGADSVANRTPTRGRFIFESTDTVRHRFSVIAVDNNGVSSDPAVVNFWTLAPYAPVVSVLPFNATNGQSSGLDTVLGKIQVAIRYRTDRFRGLRVDFAAVDRQTDDITYSWSVDDTVQASSWSAWDRGTIAYVTASDFKPIVNGDHWFYVRAKNRWGAISNTARGLIRAIVPLIDDPTYVHRILVYNNNAYHTGSAAYVDSNQIKSFYSEVMDSLGWAGKYDIWNVGSAPLRPVPNYNPVVQLGRYSTIIFLTERKPGTLFNGFYQIDVDRRNSLQEYLNAGGNLIFSGPVDSLPILISNFSQFFINLFHAYPQALNGSLDFAGSKGGLGYPNVRIDPTRVPASDSGAVRSIMSFYPIGFGESIGSFDSKSNNPLWENAPLGVRFLGPDPDPPARRTFTTVLFGFPLYYAYKSDVIQVLRKALSDCHE